MAPQSQVRLCTRKAADGGRTRDLKLGKLALYQLSYRRMMHSLSVNLQRERCARDMPDCPADA
jgi:hypothetical protein